MPIADSFLRQRADLTFRQNRHHGRHGWLRLTPAYSVRLVEQILLEHVADSHVVFDPFSGTGTTALCAAYLGKTGVATDINPFLVWFGRAKADHYSKTTLVSYERAVRLIAKCAANPRGPTAPVPPLSNIERWWPPAELQFLLRLKAAIDVQDSSVAPLLQVAFCRTLMAVSNAAFNHQSMSFKPAAGARKATTGTLGSGRRVESLLAQFLSDARHIAVTAADNPRGSAEYILADARGANSEGMAGWRNRIDLLVTSPPYPNRMSYIRELRPYMYWLQFLVTARQAGELDWEAIGGTWGIATSRLSEWVPSSSFIPRPLPGVLPKIRAAHATNGPLLANYVHKYFEDMLVHLQAVVGLLARGASVHYVIGNSIFYGNLVPAETCLAQQMAAVGLENVRVEPIRKRNSKKNLFEFHVSASKV